VAERDLLSADEAMAELNVRAQTLYSYVSRGLIRSVGQAGKRERFYAADDIAKLKLRAAARAGHGPSAAAAMQFGQPIIPTRLVELTVDGPRYRGRLATELAARGVSYEAVAELLWTGRSPETPVRWRSQPMPAETLSLVGGMQAAGFEHLLEQFSLVALSIGMHRGSVADRIEDGNPIAAARQMIQAFTACFGLVSPHRALAPLEDRQGIAEGLATALAISVDEQNVEALNALLVLFADHELSPGTFAARIAASSGSALHPCIVAAMCTHMGWRIGRLYDAVETSLDHAEIPGRLDEAARRLIDRGEVPAGFTQPLYPDGDPRGRYILDLVRRRDNLPPGVEAIFAHIDVMWEEAQLRPRHELAVATLTLALGIPRRSAGALFALSRLAGLVAHVLEQRQDGALLRPRAKFMG
jgi:citrate synthase